MADPRGAAPCDPRHPAAVARNVTQSYICGMSFIDARRTARARRPERPRQRRARDPIGLAVAALNKLAQSELLDRLGLRKQAEQTVFTVTRGGFRTIGAAGRAFARSGQRAVPARACRTPTPAGVFDLTPTEDEQMLVDVVTEFAAEVVRPAAAEADDACAAPDDVLEAALEIGLPILGVPEALGGISEERAAMAGTLVAEALAKGDLGLAVAALAPGRGRHRDRPLGHRRAAADLPPGLHRRRRRSRPRRSR